MKRMLILSLALAVGFGTAVVVSKATSGPQQITARAQWVEVFRTPMGLIAGADLIVVARHVSAQPGRVVGSVPYTMNGFQIEETIKGMHDGPALLVEQTGGRAGEHIVSIDDGGPFEEGRSYLLFLKSQGNGVFYQINHQARYEIDGDRMVGVDPTDAVVAAFHNRGSDSVVGFVRDRADRIK